MTDRSKVVDSVGTCSVCGYYGPGPWHPGNDDEKHVKARGYAECQADVVAHGKHGDFLSVRDFLVAISIDEHIGAVERAKAHAWMESNGWELRHGIWYRDDQEMREEHTVAYWHEQVGAAERAKEGE